MPFFTILPSNQKFDYFWNCQVFFSYTYFFSNMISLAKQMHPSLSHFLLSDIWSEEETDNNIVSHHKISNLWENAIVFLLSVIDWIP